MDLLALQRAFWDRHVQPKVACRTHIAELRQQLHPRAAAYKSRLIRQILLQMPEIQSAQTIAAYAAVRNEVDLSGLLHELRAQGKCTLLPKVCGQNMRFLEVTHENPLKEGAFGIPEPDERQSPSVTADQIDAFIVPGVAFDLFGNRIGYGGGFYDRYLTGKRDDALTIGAGYDFQLIAAFTGTSHDIRLDRIVTDAMHTGSIVEPRYSRFETHSPDQTRQLAAALAKRGAAQEPAIALHGDLGTGKTEFVKGLAQACGCTHTVSSPTFVFIHEYEGKKPLRHIDCYRIEELRTQDHEFWHEALSGAKGCVVIEWAERIGPLLPHDTVHLYGMATADNTRIWHLFTAYQHQKRLHENSAC